MKYTLDTVCTGNHKADNINSRVMEVADDIATELALQDWGETRANFYVEASDGSGEMMCEEAHGIWEVYYDKYVDILYNFTNTVIEIDKPTPQEIKAENLNYYICCDEERYESMEEALELLEKQSEIDGSVDANDIVLVWENLEGKTVDGILELI